VIPAGIAHRLRPRCRADAVIHPEPPRRPVSVTLFALWFVMAVATGTQSYVPERHLSDSWAAPAVLLGLLSLLWPRDRSAYRRFASVVLVAAAAFVGETMATGLPPGDALRIGLVNVAVPLAALAAYHRAVPAWFPRGIPHVVLYACLATGAAAAIVYLGGIPGGGLGGTGEARYDVAWIIRLQINLVFTGLVTFAIWHPPRPTYCRLEYPSFLPLLALLALFCLTIPYLYPQYPLAWLVCVPWVWLGLVLTPRVAGWAAIGMVLLPAAVARTAWSRLDEAAWLPSSLVMEQLMTISVLLGFIILALRESTARLSARTAAAAAQEAAENALLETVVRTVDDGVILADRRGRILISNPAARRLLGPPAAPPGPAGEAEPPWPTAYGLRALDGTDLSQTQLTRLVNPTREPVHVRVRRPAGEGRRDGADLVYAVAAQALGHLDPPLTLVVLCDVTAEERRTAQLETFAAAVAHDLKNPLASLALWMDVAEDEVVADAARGREALDRAREVGWRMRQLIDDYLAYTVTREGTLRPAVVDLAGLVPEVTSMYAVGERQAEIDVDIDLAAVVMADPALVRQVLANLVANSVKYARPGEPPRIRISTAADAAPGWVRVSVADRGIGIDPADRERVFAPFERSAEGAASGRSGIGLGLALCQAIVTRHGGRISADGNAWGGTTVTFTLPEARAAVAS
jgi:signal transduction histidine kinase